MTPAEYLTFWGRWMLLFLLAFLVVGGAIVWKLHRVEARLNSALERR